MTSVDNHHLNQVIALLHILVVSSLVAVLSMTFQSTSSQRKAVISNRGDLVVLPLVSPLVISEVDPVSV
jgi:hypothetical protein